MLRRTRSDDYSLSVHTGGIRLRQVPMVYAAADLLVAGAHGGKPTQLRRSASLVGNLTWKHPHFHCACWCSYGTTALRFSIINALASGNQ